MTKSVRLKKVTHEQIRWLASFNNPQIGSDQNSVIENLIHEVVLSLQNGEKCFNGWKAGHRVVFKKTEQHPMKIRMYEEICWLTSQCVFGSTLKSVVEQIIHIAVQAWADVCSAKGYSCLSHAKKAWLSDKYKHTGATVVVGARTAF
jgi:hypothetical protein